MKDGKFKKGNVPWNFGKKGIHLSPDTEFKKGEMVGKDHYSWKGGEQFNKNDCAYLYSGANQRVRRPKKLYEDAHGVIPKGWVIYHLDRDKDNDDLDNLIAIPRAVLLKINNNRIGDYEIKKAIEDYETNSSRIYRK